MLNPPVNGNIQGLFEALESFSSTFQGKVNFQGLFTTVLYNQVPFKPMRSLYNTACYKKDLDITWTCGFQIFTIEFYFRIGKWPFSFNSFVKLQLI